MLRGVSSVGRALRSHRRGQGFESPILHRMYSCRGPFTVGLGVVVTLATLARPEALVTFTILILATDLGRLNRSPVTGDLPWGKRDQ